MKHDFALLSLFIIASVIWLFRWQIYTWLSLSQSIDEALFLQWLPLLLLFALTITSSLIMKAERKNKAQSPVSPVSPSMPPASPQSACIPSDEIKQIKDDLALLKEKITDISAMSKIRKKRGDNQHA